MSSKLQAQNSDSGRVQEFTIVHKLVIPPHGKKKVEDMADGLGVQHNDECMRT